MIFILLLCGAMGCAEDTAVQSNGQSVSFDEDFQLSVDERVTVTGHGSNEVADSVLIEVMSMQDNRCPKGGNCIRAGEVQLKIIASSRQQTRSIATCIGVDCGVVDEEFRNPESVTETDTTLFTLNGKSYKLLFKEATPYPEAAGNKGANKAILKVVR